jgi:abhydrolase domain-containing protein 17
MKLLTDLISNVKIDKLFNRTVFQPPLRTVVSSEIRQIKVESLNHCLVDYIYIRSPNMKSNYCILYSHGNGEDITNLIGWGKFLAETLNINVLLYDYPGYGRSQNTTTPSEIGCYCTISEMYQLLRTKYNIRTKNIILMGTSIGTGPTINLASNGITFAGIILVSPFRSCAKIFTQIELLETCDIFNNESKISNIECPVLIVHGKQDQLISPDHSLHLFSKLPAKSRYHLAILEGSGHNDLSQNGEYLKHIEQFISDLKKLK